jgi:DNA-directed RNA polymerase subunit alpha
MVVRELLLIIHFLVIEDVARLIINLKNIRFKIKDGSERAVVNYSFSGYKEVKGEDFANELVEVATPDAHFATINDDGELNFTIVVEKGMGYVPSEEIRDQTEDGFLPLDAIFTPVKKGTYSIEKVLVEDNPNFEKIVFTIETDGIKNPEDVFKEAVGTMFKQLDIFKSEFGITAEPVAKIKSVDDGRLKVLLTKIEELNFSARSHNCLTRSDIKYVGEVAVMDEAELAKVKNLGKKSLDEIKAKLEEIGFPVTEVMPSDLRNQFKEKLAELKG